MASNLTPQGRTDLAKLETVVREGAKTFLAVANALLEIHDRKLYKEYCSTFESYVQVRFGFTRAHAYRQIDAARTIGLLSPGGDILPTNEAQTRELSDVPPEQVAEVWHEAVEEADGAQPSASVVRRVAAPVTAAVRARRAEKRAKQEAAKRESEAERSPGKAPEGVDGAPTTEDSISSGERIDAPVPAPLPSTLPVVADNGGQLLTPVSTALSGVGVSVSPIPPARKLPSALVIRDLIHAEVGLLPDPTDEDVALLMAGDREWFSAVSRWAQRWAARCPSQAAA